MFIAYSFIGILPEYAIHTVKQSRMFFKGDIYLIIDDFKSPYLKELESYNITIINYLEVMSMEFVDCYNRNQPKFTIVYGLKERSLLFVRCFERFFLLHNLMKKWNLTDGFFMELDNMIYADPQEWFAEFSKYEMCYMFDNYDRCSSGVMYINNHENLQKLLNFTIGYIDHYHSHEWMNEMSVLYQYYKLNENTNTVQIIPTHWDKQQYQISSVNFDKYGSIFDAAAIGIYFYGNDPNAVNAPATPGVKNKFSLVDYTVYSYNWIEDDQGRKIPHIFDGQKMLRINNLHIYTKDLKAALS